MDSRKPMIIACRSSRTVPDCNQKDTIASYFRSFSSKLGAPNGCALTRLVGIIDRAYHWFTDLIGSRRVPYEPVAIAFPASRYSAVYIRELEIESEGASRGSHNLPAQDNFLLDDFEQRIVTSIETERDKAYEVFGEHLRIYDERLGAVQIHGPLRPSSRF